MSPLVSEDGVCVPDAVQHDAPHALLQTRSDGIGASCCSADPGPSQTLRFCFGRGGFQTRPYETPELCKVPDLQCITAAAHVRLSESRGYSTLRPCCIASGTQARFYRRCCRGPVTL
jgi:hypothetical protein